MAAEREARVVEAAALYLSGGLRAWGGRAWLAYRLLEAV